MKNLLKFYDPLKQKIEYFLLKEDYEKDQYRNNTKLQMLRKKFSEGYVCECEDNDKLLKDLLNLSKNLVNYIVNKEDEEKNNTDTFYEILYIGLQNNFLSWHNLKNKLKDYYDQGKITETQYNTLLKQYYLKEEEWSEK